MFKITSNITFEIILQEKILTQKKKQNILEDIKKINIL
jgi:hypothetical protein